MCVDKADAFASSYKQRVQQNLTPGKPDRTAKRNGPSGLAKKVLGKNNGNGGE